MPNTWDDFNDVVRDRASGIYTWMTHHIEASWYRSVSSTHSLTVLNPASSTPHRSVVLTDEDLLHPKDTTQLHLREHVVLHSLQESGHLPVRTTGSVVRCSFSSSSLMMRIRRTSLSALSSVKIHDKSCPYSASICDAISLIVSLLVCHHLTG
ncbi:hypothetical protein PINS_up020200 [Pythium insidiosum]|nr:hypothetical protein PINS_up020200 [Pythium insidiosum]